MKMDVVSRDVEVSPDVKLLVERRLTFALSRFGSAVSRARVSLSDHNGPRGGLDKHCLIEVKLKTLSGPIVVEVTDAQMEAAVSRAAERVARRVKDELERRRDRNRRPRDERAAAADPGLGLRDSTPAQPTW